MTLEIQSNGNNHDIMTNKVGETEMDSAQPDIVADNAFILTRRLTMTQNNFKDIFNNGIFKKSDSSTSMEKEIERTKLKSELRQKLLDNLKRQIKLLMEESVNRKSLHEDCATLNSLCSTIDACLQFGLKKRSLGLFRESTTFTLLCKIAPSCNAAQKILDRLSTKIQTGGMSSASDASFSSINSPDSMTNFAAGFLANLSLSLRTESSQDSEYVSSSNSNRSKHAWIRIGIVSKNLPGVVSFLQMNACKYYEKESILLDVCDGPLFVDLLDGPCTLDYSSCRFPDQNWADPRADELMMRHQILTSGFENAAHELLLLQPTAPNSSILKVNTDIDDQTDQTKPETQPNEEQPKFQRQRADIPGPLSISRCSSAASTNGCSSAPLPPLLIDASGQQQQQQTVSRRTGSGPSSASFFAARDHVDSLHQSARSELLYGKNNVRVQTRGEFLLGYLSLHKSEPVAFSQVPSLSVKWTPNSAVNPLQSEPLAQSPQLPQDESRQRKISRSSWNQALNIGLDQIVYIHCHPSSGTDEEENNGGSLVLISQEGMQQPPLHFPPGGHLCNFLQCLDQGLLPFAFLEPVTKMQEVEQAEGDHLYRIVYFNPVEAVPQPAPTPLTPSNSGIAGLLTSPFNKRSRKVSKPSAPFPVQTILPHKCSSADSIKNACHNMRLQILSRAFHGWLRHCRWKKALRERLSKLVSTTMVYLDQPELVDCPLSKAKWDAIESDRELLRWIYFSGCEHQLRREMWPVLLGLYSFKASEQDKHIMDQGMRAHYEEVLCEWLPVQTIVEQREKDAHLNRISMLKRQEQNQNSRTSFDSGQATMDEQGTPDANVNNPFKGINSDIFSDFWINFRTKVTGSPPPINQSPSLGIKSEGEEDGEQPVEQQPNQGTRSEGEEDEEQEEEEQEIPLTPKNIAGSTVTSPSQNSFVSAHSSTRTNNSTATDEFQTPCSSMTHTFDNSANSTTFEEEEEGDDTSSQSSLNSHPNGRRKSSRFSREQLTGVSYPNEILDAFAINLHRIDKDVARCDRNYAFYGTNKHSCLTPGEIDDTGERNLQKLRNVMCTWVWQHMDTGYVQGMCDLLAPLLVVLQEEHLAHACFTRLMCWMLSNFPQACSGSSGIVDREKLTPKPCGNDDTSSRPRKLQRVSKECDPQPQTPTALKSISRMDSHFENLGALIELLDPTLYEHLSQNCEQGQFYFCYRWFLLDFKREFQYEDIFTTWETIWAARLLGLCDCFNLFVALAIIQYYRDLVLCYDMDFTDIIKFFNERAEHHEVAKILTMARNLVYRLQTLLTEE